MWFIPHCDTKSVQMLIDYGADIMINDEQGDNAIEHAEMYHPRCADVVQLLEDHEMEHNLEYYHHEDL